MKLSYALLAATCLLPRLVAAPPVVSVPAPAMPAAPALPPLPVESKSKSQWVFSLLPKSLQRHPSVDFNVITEMTAEGKKFPLPTPDKPIYYVEQPGKFTQLGNESPANEKPPPIAELERAMQKALATNSYLASPEAGGPTPRLLVVFNFGSFARFSTGMEEAEAEAEAEQAYQEAANKQPPPNPPPDPPEASQVSPDTADQLLPYVMSDVSKRRDVLERAALIGGARFAKQLGDAIEKEIDYRNNTAVSAVFGGHVDPATDPASPFNMFRNNNEKLMSFVEEAFSSCYFVIASAYDYAAVAKGNHLLLWRTKMTVNSLGVSMNETLPSLIVAAGPYLGREMSEAATLTKKISREGHVEIGTPTVVDDSAKPAPAPAPNKPAPPKP